MLNWKDIFNNIVNKKVNFNDLTNEELIKYYIILFMQISTFETMDNYSSDDLNIFTISNDEGFTIVNSEGDKIETYNENLYLKMANTAKYSYNCLNILRNIITNNIAEENFNKIYDELFISYSEEFCSNN